MAQRRLRTDVDMTQGNIFGHIIRFALPLLAGNLFQQLYNTVDTWVVGNYATNDAYTAVGAVTPIINMLIGAFMGLSSGAGVVISQYYGASQQEKVRQAVHTSMMMTLILSVAFTVIGLCISPLMLDVMGLQEAAKKDALDYLNIYFAGVVGLMVYNMGAGILRAVGDSQRPFYFLVICALLNTVLDLLFVAGFHWGAAGASAATVISQCVSAVLVVTLLLRSKGVIRLEIKKLKIHTDVLKKVLRVGVPSALQMAVTAFSNVFVQSYITYFDRGLPSSYYMSGWTSYLKVDQLLFLPVQSIALATTTFVGQNLGSNQPKRAKEGVRSALLLSIATTVAIMIPVMIFAPDIVGFLNPEPEVIKTGAMFLRLLTPFFIFHGFNQIYACALRGAGNSKIPMIMMLTSFVLFRQIYLFVMSRVCNEVVAIALGYPAGWILCTLLTGIYYHTTRLEKSRLVE